MADDEFAGREQSYNNNLGAVIGRFATAIVEADSMAKDAHLQRALSLFEVPNPEFSAKTSLIGMKDGLETKISVPAITATDVRPVVIEEATLELDMTVSASRVSENTLQSKTAMKGSAGFRVGWGIFSVSGSMEVSSDVSVGKMDKRSSDYRSHTNAKMRMVQGPLPEGLALIMDALNKNTSGTLELNKMIVAQQANRIAQSSEVQSGELPEAEATE